MTQSRSLAVFPSSLQGFFEAMNQQIRHQTDRSGAPHFPAVEASAVADRAVQGLVQRADEAAVFLKTLGHEGRLAILCHLCSGEKSVTELENLLSSRQSVVSQQLARLRFEGLVQARREGQTIFYSILDPKVVDAIALLSALYRAPAGDRPRQ